MSDVKFKIDFCYGNEILVTENRTHTTGVDPSERMCVNALHTICLKNKIAPADFGKAYANVYKNGKKVNSYTL